MFRIQSIYICLALFIINTTSSFSQTGEHPYSEHEITKIDQPPIFNGCEGYDNYRDIKKCLSLNMQRYVAAHFDYKVHELTNLPAKDYKMFVTFKIDKNGAIKNVEARGPHQEMEWEAERVVKSIPKMKPGIHEGEPVNVKYALPILFKITKKDVRRRKRKQKNN